MFLKSCSVGDMSSSSGKLFYDVARRKKKHARQSWLDVVHSRVRWTAEQ